MKNSLTLFVTLFLFSSVSFAQTKMIAHKSHSGLAATFKHSLKLDGFNNTNSNFGGAPTRIIQNAHLDSIIFLNDTTAIMVTSDYCTDRYSNDTSLWKAGKDTVYNHPLFSKKNSLEVIKKTLDRRYYFSTPADSTIFIGHEQNQNHSKKEIQIQDPNQNPQKNQKQGLTPNNSQQQQQQQQQPNGKQTHEGSGLSFFYLFLLIVFISLLVATGQRLVKKDPTFNKK